MSELSPAMTVIVILLMPVFAWMCKDAFDDYKRDLDKKDIDNPEKSKQSVNNSQKPKQSTKNYHEEQENSVQKMDAFK